MCFCMSTPAIRHKTAMYIIPNNNSNKTLKLYMSMLIFIETANSKNNTPEHTSIIIYLGLIFSLQYLHLPPRLI